MKFDIYEQITIALLSNLKKVLYLGTNLGKLVAFMLMAKSTLQKQHLKTVRLLIFYIST